MPNFLKSYLNGLGGAVEWLFHWAIGVDPNWIRWVNSTLNGIVQFAYQSYILLTYDIANFSYYVGSFAQAVHGWVVDIRYTRIPEAIATAEKYAYDLVSALKSWTKQHLDDLKAELLTDLAYVYNYLLKAINKEITDREKAVADLQAFLVALIIKTADTLLADIKAEAAARKKEVHQLRVWAREHFAKLWAYARSILPTVDKEAADGYDGTLKDQAAGLAGMISDLATDNPLVASVINDLATAIIDLAGIDDPLLRKAAQFLLKEVIDRLGVDKLAAGLVGDLASQVLGAGPPKTLQDVTSAIGGRLNTQESQWAQFYAKGGDDLETLGNQMRESSNPLFTVGMAAYFIGAVTDPEGTATATDAVLSPAVDAVMTPLIALLSV